MFDRLVEGGGGDGGNAGTTEGNDSVFSVVEVKVFLIGSCTGLVARTVEDFVGDEVLLGGLKV